MKMLKPKQVVKEIIETNDDRKEGKKHTNMFITINTNQTTLDILPQFRQVCREYFNKLEDYIDFRDNKKNTLDYIDIIDCKYKIEIGPKNHTIHVHALIKITHHTYIRMMIRELKEDIRKAMNIATDFHLDTKFLKSDESELNILQYMQKKYSIR